MPRSPIQSHVVRGPGVGRLVLRLSSAETVARGALGSLGLPAAGHNIIRRNLDVGISQVPPILGSRLNLTEVPWKAQPLPPHLLVPALSYLMGLGVAG